MLPFRSGAGDPDVSVSGLGVSGLAIIFLISHAGYFGCEKTGVSKQM
jgi:hypothetical protein